MMKAEEGQELGKAAESAMNAYPLGRWTLKSNPFKSASKPGGAPVVQGELSLDKVKVLRNDLSDSDLELVAASKGVKAMAETGNVFASASVATSVKPSWWARVWPRWFRSKAQ